MRALLPDFEENAAKQLGLRSIVAGFLLALSLQIASFYTNISEKDAAFWVVHTVQVDSQINQVFSLIQDLETGQRGFLLTLERSYLQPFDNALSKLHEKFESLAALISDNPSQKRNVSDLSKLIDKKVAELNKTILAGKSGDTYRALAIVRSGLGENIMIEMRSLVEVMSAEEKRLLAERVSDYEQSILISRALSVSALIVALGLLGIVLRRGSLLINRSIKDFVEFRDKNEKMLLEARQKAETSNKAKSEFLASMSHEIRTPMTGVFGLTEMLSQTSLDPEQRNLVDNMHSANQMLKTVINDILDQSKIEAGKLSVEQISLELRSVTEEAISIFHPKALKMGIHFHASICDTVPGFVQGDPTRLRQVLFNLVSNAIKFTVAGEVSIKINAKDDDHIEFKVIDTGEGIPDEMIARLFQPFEQADNSVSRKHGGTGLGLVISKSLVELMGGEIGVSSKVGVGSTFWFRIPLPETETLIELESGLSDANVPQADDHKALKILVAEDVEINQMVIEHVLTGKGHTCVITEDGEKVVDAIQKDDYDLVLMDIRMPNVDGIEAFKRIRAIKEERCAVPIIALTADVTEDQVSKFLQLGFDGIAFKPINPDKLFEIIGRAIQGTKPSLSL